MRRTPGAPFRADSIGNGQSGDFTTGIDFVDIGRHRYDHRDHGMIDTGFFNGMIDDVRIYDSALTQEQINTQVIPEPGTVLIVGVGGLAVLRRRRRQG